MSLKIGITGGIGVGKSFCSKIFEGLGVPIYDADSRAKSIMVENEEVKSKLISAFGNESYLPSGMLNREYLSQKIFNNSDNVKTMNAIVHPAVGMDSAEWFAKLEGLYGMYEAALMFETGSAAIFDKIIVVDAPMALRISRVRKRDNVSEDQVLQRINKQLSQNEKISKASFVILNDEKSSVLQQIWDIHQKIKNLA